MKRLLLSLCLGAAILGGCDDDLTKVGTSIQEDRDKIFVAVDSFRLDASTILLDAVYAKTDTGLLGEIYDPVFGSLKCDYICQFYCPEEYKFAHTPIDGKIDSVNFRIFYHTWVGDSLAPMRAQIYQVTQPLERNFYTNINPADYCDMKTSLGTQTYTAYDPTVPDSIRNEVDYYGYPTFYPSLTIRMPKELGQNIYNETVNNPSSFSNQEAFNRFFPGLYITNTFGSGNILGVDISFLTIHYKYMGKGSAEQDTIINTSEVFNVTKEVIQLNRFKNTDMSDMTAPNQEFTYMKTPAGVCTKLVIPAKDIAPLVKGRILNNMPLTLYAMPQEEYDFAWKMPTKLLLLPEDSVKTFFEEGQIENYQTSFVATYNETYRAYPFGNISNVLKNHIEKDPESDLSLVVIPINQKTESSSYYGTYTVGVSNYLFPAGVKLRKDDAVTMIGVTSSRYGTD